MGTLQIELFETGLWIPIESATAPNGARYALFSSQSRKMSEVTEIAGEAVTCTLDTSTYDQPLHIAAVFIVLASSLIGSVFPRLFSSSPLVIPC